MKKIFLLAVFATSLFVTSCDDGFEEVNSNPNAPEFVLPNTIFNSATKQYTDLTRDGFQSGRLTLPWMQYWGQNAYADEDRYIYRETSADALYRTTYLIATEFQSIININSDPITAIAASAVGNNDNQIAASRIMLSYMFHQLTDFFGDVPYWSFGSDDPEFQALQNEVFLSPVFAPSQKIYTDILKELRESADMINTSAPVFITGDNVLGGDAAKWKKFANSLILRVATRLKSTDPATANAAIAAAIADGVMTSNADNAVQKYEASDLGGSPFWIAFLTRFDFAPTAPFVNYLKGQDQTADGTNDFGPDPRLFEMVAPKDVLIADIKADNYDRSENPDDYEGIPYAFRQANLLGFDSYSFGSSKVIRPDFGEVLLEFSEVQFLRSEINNWDQGFYESGVSASLEKWGVDPDAATAFVANLPAANQYNVLTQKYVALYMQGHEAWSEYRRTGFPNTDLLLLPGETGVLSAQQAEDAGMATYIFEAKPGSTDLPFRLRYPVNLQTLNGTNLSAAVSRLPNGDTILSKLFWDNN